MRRLSIAAILAVPLLLVTDNRDASASPPGYEHFGIYGHAFKIFPHIHQHGPLFNYGPYYGYYPFTPYGPWDPYLRYDPFFYGDPYANWGQTTGNPYHGHEKHAHGGHSHGHGFWHASWLHGGWFRGHKWMTGADSTQSSCSSCGGVATATPIKPTGDVTTRYAGIGSPAQSAVFYTATPTLDPVLDLVPTSGRSR